MKEARGFIAPPRHLRTVWHQLMEEPDDADEADWADFADTASANPADMKCMKGCVKDHEEEQLQKA